MAARKTTGVPILHSTADYLVFGTKLGSGSTGDVYRGRQKKSIKEVACKVANRMQTFNPNRGQEQRMFHTLTKHPNIVEFLGVQESRETRNVSITFMELCTSSLQELMAEPQHAFGLPDQDLLYLLHDLKEAMVHLRKQHITHRDIKPGNILYTQARGKKVFKLADFDTAKQIDAMSDGYTSIRGTAQFIHPQLLGAYVHELSVDKFDVDTELWGIGCTLYQAATGRLSFVSQEGTMVGPRTLYEMVKRKPKEAIGGIRRGDGEVEWSRRFPRDVRMSASLAAFLEPVLRKTMNVQTVHTMIDFAADVDAILDTRPVTAFDVATAAQRVLYVPSGATEGAVAKMTCSDNRFVTANGKNLTESAVPFAMGKDTPLIVHPNPHLEARGTRCEGIAYFDTKRAFKVTSKHDPKADHAFTHRLIGTLMRLGVEKETMHDTYRLLDTFATEASHRVQLQHTRVETKYGILHRARPACKTAFDIQMEELHSSLRSMTVCTSYRWCVPCDETCTTALEHLLDDVRRCHARFSIGCESQLGYNDEQIHKAEKHNLIAVIDAVIQNKTACMDAMTTAHANVMEWFGRLTREVRSMTALEDMIDPLITHHISGQRRQESADGKDAQDGAYSKMLEEAGETMKLFDTTMAKFEEGHADMLNTVTNALEEWGRDTA